MADHRLPTLEEEQSNAVPEILAPIGYKHPPAKHAKQWAKGTSGNPSGRPAKAASVGEALRKIVGSGNPSNAELLAKRVIAIAMQSKDSESLKAVEFITERLEGKPIQSNLVLGAQIDSNTARAVLELAGKLL